MSQMEVTTSSPFTMTLEPSIEEATATMQDGLKQCSIKDNHFGWEDYTVLSAMLVISSLIGLFYGFVGPKQKTASDFLLGGSKMGAFPMAMSLATSFITAIELLGNPAEMYNHGTQFWMICISFFFVVPITSYLYLPVYRKLELTSAYEYLEMRFNSAARTFASLLYVIQMILYTSVAVYAPALALSHVTGLNTYLAVSCIYIVCIFYASQGGMKAVMITDTFQAGILIGSIVLILIMGNNYGGGASKIWKDNSESGRLEFFILDPNPTVRHSFWSVVIGGTFYWTTMFCSNQASIQRYMSVKTIKQVRSALWVACIGMTFIFSANFFMGMILYSEYKDCDPVKSKEVTGSDELMPLYVMETMGKMKGVPGFFVAGIFSASLGTVASALNSLAAVTTKDFINGALKIKLPEEKGALVAKWISCFFGVVSFALVFVVEQLGSVLQVALSFNGMVGGVTLGMFSLGMFFPWANSRGVIAGSTSAAAIVLWMGLGSQISLASGHFEKEMKPTSISGCACLNETIIRHSNIQVDTFADEDEGVLYIYQISYMWYSLIGFIITIIVGLVISILTEPQDPRLLNPILLSPPIRNLLQSLPVGTKKKLKLIEEDTNQISKNFCKDNTVYLTGVINYGLSMEDEKRNINNVVITNSEKI